MKRVHIRASQSGTLYFDFYWRGERWREFLKWEDTPEHRKRCEIKAGVIAGELALGTFDPARHFPNSKRLDRPPDPGEARVRAFVEAEWLPHKQAGMRPRGYQELRQTVEQRILCRFGDLRVKALAPRDLDAFTNWLRTLPGTQGKTLSPARCNKILGHLRSMLHMAYRRGYTVRDLAGDVRSQRVCRPEILPFSLEEKARFMAALPSDYWRHYFTVAFDTGLRPSEQLALRWACDGERTSYVDFPRKVLVIRQGIVRGEVTELKTVGSSREVSMLPTVEEALRRQRPLTQLRGPFVFPNAVGHPWNLANIRHRVWYPTLQRAGLPARDLYTTRHTFATTALAAGEQPAWVASVLGHTTPRMVLERYCRYVPNLTRQDGKALASHLRSYAAACGGMAGSEHPIGVVSCGGHDGQTIRT
ncbi:MAG: Arm DNA-binding domain-containing protein [Candidatus Methylomirabilales bacterium]